MSAAESERHDPRDGRPGFMRAFLRGAAGSLAVAAIVLTVWEGLENQRHNRLSVQPRVDGSSQVATQDGLWTQNYRFASAGLGPGAVTEFRVDYQDHEIWNGRSPETASGPWQPILDQLSDRYDLTATSLAIGSVLRVGQGSDDLRVGRHPRSEQVEVPVPRTPELTR